MMPASEALQAHIKDKFIPVVTKNLSKKKNDSGRFHFVKLTILQVHDPNTVLEVVT